MTVALPIRPSCQPTPATSSSFVVRPQLENLDERHVHDLGEELGGRLGELVVAHAGERLLAECRHGRLARLAALDGAIEERVVDAPARRAGRARGAGSGLPACSAASPIAIAGRQHADDAVANDQRHPHRRADAEPAEHLVVLLVAREAAQLALVDVVQRDRLERGHDAAAQPALVGRSG